MTRPDSDRFRVVARRSHPVHARRALDLESLLEYRWVLPVASPVVRRALVRLFHAHELASPEPAFESNYMSLCLTALKAHDYLGWMSELQLRQAQDPDLVPVVLDSAQLERRAGLLTRRGERLMPAARALVAELKSACALAFDPLAA